MRETKTATSHVVDDISSGMEDKAGSPLLAEMYNISKTDDESFRPMHRISSEERTNNFVKNVSYFQNSESKASSVHLTEFGTILTDVKKNLTSNDRNRMSLLQDKIVSSSVETVQIIESFDSKERVSSSKERNSVKAEKGSQERSKNFSIQKGRKHSFKKVNSSLSLLASKAETKALPPGQSNFQLGTTGTLVGEIPSAKGSFVDNISPSASSKKRKYKVKVKVRRKKLKRKNSPPPPPPPPKLSPHPSKSPPPPPPPKLSPHPSKSPPPPPPPPLPRLPRPSQPQAGFPSLPSYPGQLLPPPLITPPIPALPFPPPSVPDYPQGNSKSRNITTFPSYPPEMLTMIPYYQLQQAVQTPQCTLGGLPYVQATGHNIPCAVHNSYPSFFTAPQALPFYFNYPSTLNKQMPICQQPPVLPYTNPQPRYSNWNAGNFKS